MEQTVPVNGKVYQFSIDGIEYQSTQKQITGEQLREIAGVESRVRIYLGDHGRNRPDLLIHNTTSVNLAEPGEERFYTLPAPSLDIY